MRLRLTTSVLVALACAEQVPNVANDLAQKISGLTLEVQPKNREKLSMEHKI